jgi:hypothetical protein
MYAGGLLVATGSRYWVPYFWVRVAYLAAATRLLYLKTKPGA